MRTLSDRDMRNIRRGVLDEGRFFEPVYTDESLKKRKPKLVVRARRRGRAGGPPKG